ncbi:DUF5908 family protein [Chitinophaga tropicalis]|uniref:DUF5908 family protein n=1 Tax=Chitinophaga tropicalis TaxID=2683588 RepID=UPI0018DF927D|nr:DUF5908 family protein [Chitinophaga tropicalis]
MPVEIKELVIKVAVDETGGGKESAGRSGAQQDAPPDQIIRACVEKVLEILKDQRER